MRDLLEVDLSEAGHLVLNPQATSEVSYSRKHCSGKVLRQITNVDNPGS